MTIARYETLRFLASESTADLLAYLVANAGATVAQAIAIHATAERAAFLQDALQRFNLVLPTESTVSTRGRMCHRCIEGIEGANVLDLIDHLRELDPASLRITVVREGMTSQFVEMLARFVPLRRLMICSPWVNLDRDRLHKLIYGVETSRRARGFYPEITVVTRPLAVQPGADETETLAYFNRANSVVKFRPQLHSKLYIIESDSSPAQRLAFVGSENFTKVRFQEVGLRIHNDHQLIDDLVRYFVQLAGF